MYQTQSRFLEWDANEYNPDYWFRWGKNYATIADAFNAVRDMKRHYAVMLRFRIIHYYPALALNQ